MSVYTRIEPYELEAFLGEYDLGMLLDYQGISEGVENTNYFVTTTQGEYVLTLFESIGFDDLPYYLELMAFLAENGVQSAHPLADRSGSYLRSFKCRPAALVQRLRGASVQTPNIAQCRAIGMALGHLHVEGRAFRGWRANARGPQWWCQAAERLLPRMTGRDAQALRQELEFQSQYRGVELERGVVHADLFLDNALFVSDELTGIIDFYYACNDVLLYDLAVTVNDWCVDIDGELDGAKAVAILSAYHEWRALTIAERELWPVLLRAAALRFWLSRLLDQVFPRPGELTQIKDPNVFKRILDRHVVNHGALSQVWI